MVSELTIEQMRAAVLEKFPFAWAYEWFTSNTGNLWRIYQDGAKPSIIGIGPTCGDAWKAAFEEHCASPKASEGERKSGRRQT